MHPQDFEVILSFENLFTIKFRIVDRTYAYLFYLCVRLRVYLQTVKKQINYHKFILHFGKNNQTESKKQTNL